MKTRKKKIRDKKKNELCDFCGGALYPKTVNTEFWVKGGLILIEDAPAEVCRVCGEKYFSAETHSEIERLLKGKSKAEKTMTVPVYKLAATE
jgi:YgiT-type zinc finger domain-containing protein